MEEMNKNENVQEDVNLNAANVVDDIGMVTSKEVEDAVKQKEMEAHKKDEATKEEKSEQKSEEVKENSKEVQEQQVEVSDEVKVETDKDATEEDTKKEPESDIVVDEEKSEAVKETIEPTLEEIKAENERLKAMLEQKNEYTEIAEVEQQEQNRLVEFQKRLRADFEQQMKAYEIPMDKTLEEIRKEDPTKGKIMEDLFNMSIALVQQEEAKSRAIVQDKINKAIFKKAEQEFSKFTMTPEQEQVAAETFVNIMQRYGVEDLGDDIKEKVLTSVGRAKMLKPDVVEAPAKSVEPPKVEKQEEVKEKVKVEEKKEVVEPQKEVNMADFTQGIVGNPSATNDTVTEHNVMEILKSLPDRERPKFYKEHAALLNHVTEVNFNKHHKG